MAHDTTTKVHCDGCTECCRSGQGLVLHPEFGDDVESYRHRVLGHRADGSPVFALATDERGWCVYLAKHGSAKTGGCTIYDRRPALCHSFDCRKYYLMLPRGDRDNLVQLGLSSRAVFNAGKARLKTLSPTERGECLKVRDEYFADHESDCDSRRLIEECSGCRDSSEP